MFDPQLLLGRPEGDLACLSWFLCDVLAGFAPTSGGSCHLGTHRNFTTQSPLTRFGEVFVFPNFPVGVAQELSAAVRMCGIGASPTR